MPTKKRVGGKASPRATEANLVDIEHLPVATLVTRKGVLVAANPAYEALTGWKASEVRGRVVTDLIATHVDPKDAAVLAQISASRASRPTGAQARLWCTIVTPDDARRPIRVEWRRLDDDISLLFLLDAQPEAFGQEVTAELARVAASLSRCASEKEVLDRAVEALASFGFTTTTLLWDEHDPLLRYGPSRSPSAPKTRAYEASRLPRDILVKLNPGFMERRSAFFQDGVRVVRETYPEPLAEHLIALLPAQRMVQAPVFVGDKPYGAVVVTSDSLSPLVATALELFAELVGKAIETIRLRRENVERARLAALGEAAGVMAHEVRNPVGAIMNALSLLQRDDCDDAKSTTLVRIITEETTRLAQLVTHLLELGRPLLPRPRACSLAKLSGSALRLLRDRGEIGKRAVELPTGADVLAWIDPDLTELALVNLLRNAVQSTKADARIRVRVERVQTSDGTRATWTLEDDGPGMPDEVLEKLGQPFVTTRATGTGMGLAVVRRIAEANGATLSVSRSSLGGARLTLDFPTPPA